MIRENVSALHDRLARDEVVIIDGATGTELERNGVPMVQGAWCGASTLTHPEVLQAVHESHIAAGAQLIIANTYASSRHILEQAGYGEDDFVTANRAAIEIAIAGRDASAAPQVVVAASISTTEQSGEVPPAGIERRNYEDQARIQADSGAEVLVLEMMRDIPRTLLAIEAAATVGLPLWVGLSCVMRNGEPVMHMGEEPLGDAIAAIADYPIEVLSIMHTETEDIDACLDSVQPMWDGPLGVYAQTGKWIHPNWQFIDVVSPAQYGKDCTRWVGRGVQVVGGCCGIGPEHISHLSEVLPGSIA